MVEPNIGDTVKVTIGRHQVLGSSPARWALREGTHPVMEVFDVSLEAAQSLINTLGPYTLTYEYGDGKKDEYTNLWALQVQPGDNPHIGRIQLADRRWFWSYSHILRRINYRRRVGVKRETPGSIEGTKLDVNQQIIDKWGFAKWSLKVYDLDGSAAKWKADEVLLSILQEVVKKDLGGEPNIVIDGVVRQSLKNLPIENLIIDEPGNLAVARALSYLPEAGLYITRNGDVLIYSKTTGLEEQVLKSMGSEIAGRGHTTFVDNLVTRPEAIDVLFTREVEVRFDYSVDEQTTAEPRERRVLENVMPVPDFKLTVPVPTPPGSEEVTQGTYCSFFQVLNSAEWLEKLPDGTRIVSVTQQLLRQAYLPRVDLWSPLLKAGLEGTDSNWSARVSALQSHWRRTFGINPRWMDRIFQIRPYRISTINPSDGTRGASTVYCDFFICGSQRSMVRSVFAGAQSALYGVNVSAYPKSGVIDETALAAPATVNVIDHDQGIIHFDFRLDPYRMFDTILPGNLQRQPTEDIRTGGVPIGFNAALGPEGTEVIPELKKEWKASVILTLTPSSPNSALQLHRIRVKPDDIKDLLPNPDIAGLGDTRGPVMEIRVHPSMETARVAWAEGSKSLIEQCFGIKDGNNEGQEDITTVEDSLEFSRKVSDITVNSGDITDPQFGGSLQAIAKAIAARIYASLVNRYEGSMTTTMKGSVVPSGWLSEVVHEVTTAGETVTRVTLPDKVPQLDLLSYLDAGTRMAILKQIQG